MKIIKQFLADPTEKFAVFVSEEEFRAIAQSVARNLSDYSNDTEDSDTLLRMANAMVNELQK